MYKGLRNIYIIGLALLAAGCSSDEELISNTLSGGAKTPLRIEATLSNEALTTRAAGKTFEENDVLLAYIRHITNTNYAVASYSSITADQAPRLVAFKKGSVAMTGDATTLETTDITSVDPSNTATAVPLYWDDFSNSSATTTDLRTENHGLQSYYGYCYNGGTPSTELTESTGVLGWTIGNQTTAEAVQHADLLWSPAQTAVTYAHSTAREASSTVSHGTLTIPYTHAMSEVTVTLTAGAGFSGSPLTNTVLTLNAMNTVATLIAPTGGYSSSNSASVKMFAESYSSGLTRDFTAIVAPGTKLKVDEKLLNIVNVDDNNYEVNISSTMIDDTHWASGHLDSDKGTDGEKAYILTKPGYNYHLAITVNKTAIDVKATIKDWTTVNASGTGDVKFDDDDGDDLVMDDSEIESAYNNVSVVAVDKNKFVADATFSLFMRESTITDTGNDKYTYATIPKFVDNADDANDAWVNTPAIYWPNKSTNYYFRALAKFNSCTDGKSSISSVGTYNTDKGVSVTQGTIADGHDILWGTTAGHKGSSSNNTYARGQAISPRTGDVPIAFDHAMSKITISLETTSDESVTVYNAKVDLTDAKISITNLYTSGTINIENGNISLAESVTENAITLMSAPLQEYIVLPQAISDDAKIIITLKDGTTYKLQLNQCVDNQTTPAAITTWERGKQYNYTIHLEKEQITFRALIKDWETSVQGSGNANLEWD